MKSLKSKINDIKQCNSNIEVVNIILDELLIYTNKGIEINKKLDYKNHSLDTVLLEQWNNLKKYANNSKKDNDRYLDHESEMQTLILYFIDALNVFYKKQCNNDVEIFKDKIIKGNIVDVRYINTIIKRFIIKENKMLGECANTIISLDAIVSEDNETTLGETLEDINNNINTIVFEKSIEEQINMLEKGITEKVVVGEIFNLLSKPQKEFLLKYTFDNISKSQKHKMKSKVFEILKNHFINTYKLDLKEYIEKDILLQTDEVIVNRYMNFTKREYILNLDIKNIQKQLSEESKEIYKRFKKDNKLTEEELKKLDAELKNILKNLMEN